MCTFLLTGGMVVFDMSMRGRNDQAWGVIDYEVSRMEGRLTRQDLLSLKLG